MTSKRGPSNVARLFGRAEAGDPAATGQLLSIVERGGAGAREVAGKVFARQCFGHTIGITGAPGAGKSTLTSALLGHLRERGQRVGVLAVDPSSPYSEGAILGDRLRMGRHSTDAGVFIRSMASRGHLGGLSLATPEAVRLLGAVGFDPVIIETVGVGQTESHVTMAADTTVVVVNPGWGDAVQAAKAGLLEIADVFVVNKADRPGTDLTVQDLEQMLELRSAVRRSWRPPVIRTVAPEATGVGELWAAIATHKSWMEAEGVLELDRTHRFWDEAVSVAIALFELRMRGRRDDGERAVALGADVDPWSMATTLLAQVAGDLAAGDTLSDAAELAQGGDDPGGVSQR